MNPFRLSGGLSEGARVGPYLIRATLGAGGLAMVYRATAPDGSTVALKVLNAEETSEEQVARSRRELRALRRMNHPNVVRVLDAGQYEGRPWLALEYVGGGDLDDLARRWNDAPPPDRAERSVELLRGLARALEHVHENGVFHRDVKPSNVLIASDGTPRLTDFGAAKNEDSLGSQLTLQGRLVGTVAFMAPEQIAGEAISARTDLYGLGAVFYLLLTGRRPIEASSIAGYLSKHLMESPAPPSSVAPDVPEHLSRICMRLLRKDPGARYASAAELLRALEVPPAPRTIRLRGREALLDRADADLLALSRGWGGIRVISGPLGSGRSALVDEVAARATEDGVEVRRWPRPVTRAPTLLVVDDLDVLEPGGREGALNLLASLPEGVLALVVVRDAPAPGLLTALGAHGRTVMEWTLSPLECAEAVEVLRDRGLARSEGSVLVRRLEEIEALWPGAVLEQLAALEEAGWVRPEGQGLALAVSAEQLRDHALPVSSARTTRLYDWLSRLDASQRRRLDVMAVLGDEADEGLVDELAGTRAPPRGAGPLDVLLDRSEEGPVRVLRFRRTGYRPLIAAMLPDEERRRLHGRAADLLLERHRRRIGGTAAVIAEHLLQAGRAAEALPLLLRGARWALRRRQAAEALALVERTAPGPGDAPAQAVLGEALLALRRPEPAAEALERALAGDLTEEGPGEEARLRALLGIALGDLGRVRPAMELLRVARRELPPRSPLRFAVRRAYADALVLDGHMDEARVAWEGAAAEARASRDLLQEGSALLGLGELEVRLGDLESARRSLRQAAERLHEAGASRALAIALIDVAQLYRADGRLRQAEQQALQAAALADAPEHLDVLARASVELAAAREGVGDLAGAREALRRALQVELRRGDLPDDALAELHVLARQLLPPAAREGLRPFPSAPAVPAHARALHALAAARLAWSEGDGDRARQVATAALVDAEGPRLSGLRAGLRALAAEEVPP